LFYITHPGIIINLCNQYATTWVGVIILVGAFGFQLFNSLWELSWNDSAVNRLGVILSIVFCIIVFLISWWVADIIAKKEITKVEHLIGYVIQKK